MIAFKLKSVILRFMLALCLVTAWMLPIASRGGAQPVLAQDLESSETIPATHKPSEVDAPVAPPPRVGINMGGCAYSTIQEAVDAATSGDSIQVAADIYNETLVITKTLTIGGDYNSTCDSITGGLTEIDGTSLSGTVVSIISSTVTVRDLSIVNGSGATEGGGIFLGKNAEANLGYVNVESNAAVYGGGVFLDSGTVMTVSNSIISTNTASTLGGGFYVEGSLIVKDDSVIEGNDAPDGGGIASSDGSVVVDNSDIHLNNATDFSDGKGGGIYAKEGSDVTIKNNSAVSGNESVFGGGVFADDSTVDLSIAFFISNFSWGHGGGIHLTNDALLNGTAVRIGGEGTALGNEAFAGFGGGIYAITSTVNLTGTQFYANLAGEKGGGIYADNSVTNFYTVTVGGPDNNLRNYLSPSGHYGAGLCLMGSSTAILNASTVSSNAFLTSGLGRGGGIYIEDSSTILLENGSSVENHPPGIVYEHFGAGIYADNATVTLDDSQVISNSAFTQGGGIYAINSSIINIENNSVISGNFSTDAGGIYVDGSTVNVDTGFFYDNQAALNGGGLYLTNGGTLTGSEVLIGGDGAAFGNDAVDGSGGGIYAITSTINLDGSQVFANRAGFKGAGIYADNSTIDLNSVEVGGVVDNHPNILTLGSHIGSGMFLTGGTTAILSDTVVAGNTFTTIGSTYGGGIYLEDLSTLNLQNDSKVEFNQAPSSTEGYGAGLYAKNAAITIDNSQVLNNTAGTSGGGIGLEAGSVLNLQNFAVVSNNEADGSHGGGIYSTGSNDINIENSTVEHNTAGMDGGGIYLDGGTLDTQGWWSIHGNHASSNGGGVAVTGTGDADFAVTSMDYDTILGGNVAVGGDGGGLYTTNTDTISMTALGGNWLNFNTNNAVGSGGGAALIGEGFLDFLGHVEMTGNHAGRNGGAVFLANESALIMTASGTDIPNIAANSASNGGGVYAMAGSGIYCDGGIFGTETDGNEAIDGSGGAVYLQTSALESVNCQFLNNEATVNGGAVAANSSHVVSSSDFSSCDPTTNTCSLFMGNTADSDASEDGDGGVFYLSDSELILSHSILNLNSAFQGGGIYQTTKGSASNVADSLFFKNTSGGSFGSAIGVDLGVFHMEHVTLGDNTGGYAFQSVTTATVSVTNSIAWGNTFGFSGITLPPSACNIDQEGNAGLILDPMFVNPGFGEDYHLAWNSPAIDACAVGRPLDLDGITRPINFLYDMGAYEALRYIFLPLILK